MDNITYEYDAFISYRHTEPDIVIAEKLLTMLEKYRVPSGVSKKAGITKIKRIFRDREELPTTTDLSDSIMHALKSSRFLIVICSPRTPASEWVKKEIEVFKEIHGVEKIQALLIEGEPEESFPEALRYEAGAETDEAGNVISTVKQLELLAADIRPDELKGPGRIAYGLSVASDRRLLKKSIKLLKTERLRCIAPMLKCKFDELYQRHFRQTIRNVVAAALSVIVLFASFTGYAVYMNRQLEVQRDEAIFQKQEVERQKLQVENERKIVAEQKELAQENERQAVAFSKEADLQRKEAEHQSRLAQENEKKALENMEQAKIQEALALYNESKAEEQRDTVLKNQSMYLAGLSRQQQRSGNRMMALMLALEALPKNISNPERPVVQEAWDALNYSVNSLGLCRSVVSCPTYIEDVSYSSDGKTIAIRTYEKHLRICNADNGEELAKLTLDKGVFTAAQISPDGKTIATGSDDGVVRLWDMNTGKLLSAQEGYNDDIYDICFSPDGSKILASAYGSAILLDVKSGAKLGVLPIEKQVVGMVRFSTDGRKILTDSTDDTARIWDAENGKELICFQFQDKTLYSTGLSPDGNRLFTSFGNSLTVWDAATGKLKFSIDTGIGIGATIFSPDSRRLYAGMENGMVEILDTESGKVLAKCKTGSARVSSIDFSPDGRYILAASEDGFVDLRKAADGTFIKSLCDNTSGVKKACFSPDGQSTLAAFRDNTVRIWSIGIDESMPKLIGHSGEILSLQLSPDGKSIVTGSADGTAIIWDGESRKITARLIGHQGKVYSARFSPDGSKVVTASEDKTIRLWDAKKGKQLLLLNGHTNYANSAELSADGKRVISEVTLSTIIWDAESGKEISRIESSNSAAYWDIREKFSPDGKLAITVTYKNSVKVWNSETGGLLAELIGHKGRIEQALFSPDGKKILTTSVDGTARIWDSHNGKELLTLDGSIKDPAAASFSPDGKYAAIGTTYDSLLRIWNVESGKIYKKIELGESFCDDIEFDANGKQIMVFANYRVLIYDLESENPVVKLDLDEGENGLILKSVLSPDGNTVLIVPTFDSKGAYIPKNTVWFYRLDHDYLIPAANSILKGRQLTPEERKAFYIE